jgi:anti-sigma factor RsiW
MPPLSVCPDRRDLERLLLGLLPEAEAQALEEHVAQCGACVETLRALRADDALVEAIRAGGQAGSLPSDPVAERLMVQLRQRERDGALGGEALASLRELCAGLAPPERPGEIGRLGPYQVVKVIGTGGMGVVFQA